ncbi:MAG: formyltransferase family protein [Candidatus Azotimanducaceae bacterium]
MFGPIHCLRVACLLFVRKYLQRRSIVRLCKSKGLQFTQVTSPNSPRTISYMKHFGVEYVFLVNTNKKLSKNTLALIGCPVVNFHLGSLPEYRGVFSLFYASLNNDETYEYTSHFVDEEYDRGRVITKLARPLLRRNISYNYQDAYGTLPELFSATVQTLTTLHHAAVDEGQANLGAYHSSPSILMILKYLVLNVFKK